MSNSVDPDETAHYEPSHLDLRCLQRPIMIAYGSERANGLYINKVPTAPQKITFDDSHAEVQPQFLYPHIYESSMT